LRQIFKTHENTSGFSDIFPQENADTINIHPELRTGQFALPNFFSRDRQKVRHETRKPTETIGRPPHHLIRNP
jgi:hypothetical protein